MNSRFRIAVALVASALVFTVVLLGVAAASCLREGVVCRIGADVSQFEAAIAIGGGTLLVAALALCVAHLAMVWLGLRGKSASGVLSVVIVASITALPFLMLAAFGLGKALGRQEWLLISLLLAGLAAGVTYRATLAGHSISSPN